MAAVWRKRKSGKRRTDPPEERLMKKTNGHQRAASTRKGVQESAATTVEKKAMSNAATREENGPATKGPGRRLTTPNGIDDCPQTNGFPVAANGQKAYEEALKLTRHADKAGGPLPVALLV
jgi:hypothetical protein